MDKYYFRGEELRKISCKPKEGEIVCKLHRTNKDFPEEIKVDRYTQFNPKRCEIGTHRFYNPSAGFEYENFILCYGEHPKVIEEE